MRTTYISAPHHPFFMQVQKPIAEVIDAYLKEGYRLDHTESVEVYGFDSGPAEHLRALVVKDRHFVALSDLHPDRYPITEEPEYVEPVGETATYDNVLRKNHGLD